MHSPYSSVLFRVSFASMLAANSLLLAGCMTSLHSKPIGQGVDGVEYSLPIPLVEVVPQPDGTLAVAVKYIPDPNNRYVIATSSFLSSYTLSVETENGGLLKKVTLDAKAGDVAADAIKAAGEVRKAEVAADKDADKKADEASQATTKALADAELTLAKAEATLQRLNELADDPTARAKPEPKDLIAAEIAVVAARMARDAAAEGVTKTVGADDGKGAGKGAGKTADFPQAWGPVYYRVSASHDAQGKPTSVKLIPASFPGAGGSQAQVHFDTSEVAKPDRPQASAPIFRVKGASSLDYKASGQYTLTIEVGKGTVSQVDRKSSGITDPAAGTSFDPKPTIDVQLGGTTLVATFSAPRQRGAYTLDVAYTYANGEKADKVAIPFEIH